MKKIKLLTALSSLPILGMVTISLTSCGNKGGDTPVETKYVITFTASEGVTLSSSTTVQVKKGTKWKDITKPTVTLADGYVGFGWFDSVEMKKLEDEAEVSKDTSAKFVAFKKTDTIVNVSVKVDTKTYGPLKFKQGGTFAKFKEVYPKMQENPTKEHCIFEGWYVGETRLTDSYVFPKGTAEITIEAKFSVIKRTVNFSAVEGVTLSSNDPVVVNDGTKWADVTKPTATVSSEQQGVDWFDTDTKKKLTADTEITKDTSAKYIAFKKTDVFVNVTIVEDTVTHEPVPFVQGGTFGKFKDFYNLTDPVKEHYTFDGWYVGDTKLTDTYKFPSGTTNITIEARFNPLMHAVATTDSTAGVTFNLPATIMDGNDVVGSYTFDETTKKIKSSDCDIKVGGKSIKSKEGVVFANKQIAVPGKYVTGNISIKIVIEDKASYTITTTDSSQTVQFQNLPSSVLEGEGIDATYSYDTFNRRFSKSDCDIKVGGVSIKDKEGVVFTENKLQIPANLITGNVEIKIIAKSIVLTNTLAGIVSYCNQYEAGSLTKENFIKSFTTSDGTIQTEDELVGCLTKISINNKDHYVRIVDVDHDTLQSDPTKKAALTFELVTLLSGTDGNIMTTKWQESSNYDYTNSILRKNLTGEGSATATWSSSALSLLPSELTGADGIKTVTKQVAKNKYVHKQEYEVTTYDDKLFPLTYAEMGQFGSQYAKAEGSAYKYWNEHDNNSDRIKKDANGNAYYYWLATPRTSGGADVVWSVDKTGDILNYTYSYWMFGVSFGFCI